LSLATNLAQVIQANKGVALETNLLESFSFLSGTKEAIMARLNEFNFLIPKHLFDLALVRFSWVDTFKSLITISSFVGCGAKPAQANHR
jgi:hypothetical protein